MRIAIIMQGIAIILLCIQQIITAKKINDISKLVSKLLNKEEELENER